ncbi:predicted protein [Phaeodactylum tricornutum CCAP 1055/1]|jgi:hypothetical protein|uniref:Uncharacterized protein n=1 Tax=Phaeodactylum tricornutum (strain CCAP 1055/1) TaxID=556484 RepID=B7G175_PHATC|nr:predicted protein [Phaeodactylum tricornutum CCAP 1055/1]EEC47456.1 predicted protein [Phaeodactylum tricornutum CCAP 1055/1]|eukprot:XP_002180804.1 predicted protein [Phaeodactylum tricornutum CCAP 1055/1]
MNSNQLSKSETNGERKPATIPLTLNASATAPDTLSETNPTFTNQNLSENGRNKSNDGYPSARENMHVAGLADVVLQEPTGLAPGFSPSTSSFVVGRFFQSGMSELFDLANFPTSDEKMKTKDALLRYFLHRSQLPQSSPENRIEKEMDILQRSEGGVEEPLPSRRFATSSNKHAIASARNNDFLKGPASKSFAELLEAIQLKKPPRSLYHGDAFRSGYSSISLDQVEAATRARHKSLISNHSHERPSRTVHSFSLQFNEVSIASIANWGKNKQHNSITVSEKSRAARRRYFTVDSKFRKCGICYRWGHYELECTSQTEDRSTVFGQEVTSIRSQPLDQQKKDVAIAWKQEYEAVVENCNGYFIEQQKQRPKKPAKRKMQNAKKRGSSFDKTFMDGIVIKATGPSKLHDLSPLQQGEVVAWMTDEKSMSDQKYVNAGVVVRTNINTGRVLLRFIDTIAPSPDSTCLVRNEGTSLWIALDALHRIEPDFDTARLGKKQRKKGSRKLKPARKAMTWKKTYRRKNQSKLNANGDGTMNPRITPRKRSDGTYVAPRGRRPEGFEWEENRGLWISSQL